MERVEMFYILTTEIICAIGLGLWSLYLGFKLRFFNKCKGNMTQQQLKMLNTIEKQHNLLAEKTQLLNNMKRQLAVYKEAIMARKEYCSSETRRDIAEAHLSKLQAEEAQQHLREDLNLVKDALDDVITKISEIRKIIYTDDRAAKKIPIIIRILEGEREEESEGDAEVDEDYEEEKED